MSHMTHDDAYAELAAVALDSVSPELRAAVRAHAGACPECGPELASLEHTVAILGQLVPSASLNRGRSAGIRSRLLVRARAERESRSAPVSGRPDLARGVASLTGLGHRVTPVGQRPVTGETGRVTPAQSPAVQRPRANTLAMILGAYAALVTIAFAATAFGLFSVSSARRAMSARLAAVDTLAPVIDSLTATLNEKNAMMAMMTGPDVKTVQLMSQSSSRPLGRVMWNQVSNDWIVVTHGVRQPREGMTYQLWLVTDYARISAGTLRPDKDGKIMMHAKQALPREALRSIAITEEPMGGVTSPTGPTIAAGAA
jgi:anti-sigma-K factor RskA